MTGSVTGAPHQPRPLIQDRENPYRVTLFRELCMSLLLLLLLQAVPHAKQHVGTSVR